MLDRALAKNGHDDEYARSGRHTECIQPHGQNLGRSRVLHEEHDRHETVGIRPQRTPNRMEERSRN